uniref:Uncharacterized protein n=1 Tax=Arundo donax TaxID=35708 RepID=A0A0A9E0Z7_ARUDO
MFNIVLHILFSGVVLQIFQH